MPTDAECIFCNIVAGEAPATRVFENDAVIGIMDIFPWTKGHCLVIPKNHSANIFEIPEDGAVEVMRAVHRLAPAVKKALGSDGLNLVQSNGHAAWQTVEHFHLHLIPRWYSDSLIPPAVPMEGNSKTIEENARKIVAALSSA